MAKPAASRRSLPTPVLLLFGVLTTACATPSPRPSSTALAGLDSVATTGDGVRAPIVAATRAERPARNSDGVTARLFGGGGFLLATSLRSGDAGAIANGDASFDFGWMAGGAVGYRFANDWSVDLEMTYRTNDVDRITAPGVSIDQGDFSSLGVLANVRYYLPTDMPLRPYVGVGVGWIEEIDIDLGASDAENSFSTSGVGAQALIGAEYALTDRLSLDVEGRYFRSFADDFDSENAAGIRYDADYDRFEALFGLTWRF